MVYAGVRSARSHVDWREKSGCGKRGTGIVIGNGIRGVGLEIVAH